MLGLQVEQLIVMSLFLSGQQGLETFYLFMCSQYTLSPLLA